MPYKERYKDRTKQAAYENACDCFYFGSGKSEWNPCGLPLPEQKEVWRLAYWDMAEPDIEHGRMENDSYVFKQLYM